MRIGMPVYIPLGKSGGIETYARNLIRALQRIDDDNRYLIFCSILNESAFPVEKANFTKIVKGRYRSVEMVKQRILPVVGKTLMFMENTLVLREFKRAAKSMVLKGCGPFMSGKEPESQPGYDIVHYLFTIFPYYRSHNVPVILTVVDIQQEYHPEFFTKKELDERRRYYRPSAEKADHIIAISGFTRKSLIEKYGIPGEKISVVYLGYDENAFKKAEGGPVEDFRIRRKLPKDFILYPAATWPHKNHINLVRAYRIMRDKYGLKAKLVLTGIRMQNHDVVEKEIVAQGLRGDIIHLGYLPYEELPLLYNAAGLLVFPSLFEGFGMPVVEAMASGLPVACSNTTSLPEVGGDAAVYFDPENPEDIAGKVSGVYQDRGMREALARKGLERARLFTWERTAEETLKIYERVYRGFNTANTGQAGVPVR